MIKPRFTDSARHQRPYVRSDEMGENYLQRRFAEIRAEQERNASEQKQKVATMKKVRTA